MTQEEKQILLKDLCARLPYGVMCDRLGHSLKLAGVHPNKEFALEFDRGEYIPTKYTVDDVKPYLRPMSSMTEEEEVDFTLLCEEILSVGKNGDTCILSVRQIDWLLSHHFDYRGLIDKGLALEATEGMYKQ